MEDMTMDTISIENGGKDGEGKGGAGGGGGKGAGGKAGGGKGGGGKGRKPGRFGWLGEEWVLQVALVGAVFAALADAVARIGSSTII
jgi:hypothetical protein